MRKSLALFGVILILIFPQYAVAETMFTGLGFQMMLPDGWTIADSTTLAQIETVLPEMAQASIPFAFDSEGAALCAFTRLSEGMTIELMTLFQSEYVNRIKEALSFCKITNIETGSASFGSGNFFYISLTAMETPVWVLYHFSDQLVITVCFAGTQYEDIASILSTLSPAPETFVPALSVQ